MPKLIDFYNVRVITPEMVAMGTPSLVVGRQRDGNPNIQHGFLIYENLDGGVDGVNLAGAVKFTIEPKYQEGS